MHPDAVSIDATAPNGDTVQSQQYLEQIAVANDWRPKKKKPAPTKKADLGDLVIDNELRALVGLNKLKLKTVTGNTEEVREHSEKAIERKGIRKEKKLTPAKKKILKTRENSVIPESQGIICSFSPTPLDEMVINLLKKLKKQIDAVYEVNQTKARAKRSFVCGLHESLKHVRAENVKCVIVARNLDEELMSGPSLFHVLRDECTCRQIPLVHASSKRLLSRAVQKFPYTNIIALFHFHGIYRENITLFTAMIAGALPWYYPAVEGKRLSYTLPSRPKITVSLMSEKKTLEGGGEE